MQYPLAKLPHFTSAPSYVNPRSIPQTTQSTPASQPVPTSGRKGTGGFTDQEIQIATLKKENFSLKLRLFYLTNAAEAANQSLSTDSKGDQLSKVLKQCAELKYLLSLYQSRDEKLDADSILQNDLVKKARIEFDRLKQSENNEKTIPDPSLASRKLLDKTLQATAIPVSETVPVSTPKPTISPPLDRTSNRFEKDVKDLEKKRDLLVSALKKARKTLKQTVQKESSRMKRDFLRQDQQGSLEKERKERKHKCLAFIAHTLKEMSLELDSVTWSIYKSL